MTSYQMSRDEPRAALRMLSLGLNAHSGGEPMPDNRMDAMVYLAGTLARAIGLTLDEARALLKDGGYPEDMVDGWYTDRVMTTTWD
jgi:hypothetical protein